MGVDADGPFFGVVSGRGENSEATEDAPGLRTGVCALLIVGGERSGRASKHRPHAVGGLVPDGLSQISMLSIAALVLSYSITPRAGPISMSSSVAFSKYHGLGNDFVLVDCREAGTPALSPEEAAKMCDRNFGVGADGVIFVLPPDVDSAKHRMRIYNSDGSEPEMAQPHPLHGQLVADVDKSPDIGIISTLAGPIVPEMQADGTVKVDMASPSSTGRRCRPRCKSFSSSSVHAFYYFSHASRGVRACRPTDADGKVVLQPLTVAGKEWQVTCVSMGNPHAIVFVTMGMPSTSLR